MEDFDITPRLVATFVLAGSWGLANGYKVETHEMLTAAAVRMSKALGPGSRGVYADLGLAGTERFLDEENRSLSIPQLLRWGAVREDDNIRSLNHFYDPQNNGRGLTVVAELGYPSPQWALEDDGPLPSHPLRREQRYSLRLARSHLVGALTKEYAHEREREFGLTFRILGQVIHHMQDMAQPEHVRNDDHLSGIDNSYYEQWTNENRLRLNLVGYPLPDPSRFAKARSFWTHQGEGIAEFTSHNFVSKDTNFAGLPGSFRVHPQYPRPSIPANPPLEKTTLRELIGWPSEPLASAEVWFIGAEVHDAYQPALSRFNPRASTFSILSPELKGQGFALPTSLNRFNFAAAHEFLLPRAVAYSAGLIDYFFRGRLALDALESAGGTVTVRVRNVSAADFVLGERSEGRLVEFSLYYDARSGARRRLELRGDDLAGQVMAAGATRTFSFDLPADLAAERAQPFMLVFEGAVGEEPGVAALAFAAPAPRGFLVQPNYLPADGVAGPRLITFEEGRWKLSARDGLTAGNVDWRGDEPGEVLSWEGPPSRYFYSALVHGYSPRIYHAGRVLAHAPGPVQGVAIRTEGSQRWLTVAVYAGNALRLYARPFRWSYRSDGLYDPLLNPEGWRLLHAEPMEAPATPTFFNASGTEAQALVRSGSSTDRFRKRVRVRLGAAVAVEIRSAKGAGTWRRTSDSDYDPRVTVIEGVGQACATTPGEVLEFACRTQGICVNAAGAPHQTCLDARREFEIDATARTQTRVDYDFTTPTVICVDYRGDEEVLCEITRDAASTEIKAHRRRYRLGERRLTDASCGSDFTAESVTAAEGRESTTISEVRRLRFGAVEVPLSGHIHEGLFQESSQLTLAEGALTPAGTASAGNVSTTYDTRILYLDARHDLAVVQTNDAIRTIEGQSTHMVRDITQWAYRFDVGQRAAARQELLVYFGGQRHVLHSQEEATDALASPSVHRSALGVGGQPSCTPESSNEPGAAQPFVDDFVVDGRLLLNPSGNPLAVTHGYAVDAAGRLVASQIIWVRRPDGTLAAEGVWSFLSGGELEELLPPGAAGAAFHPIGVID